jgi:hypothetical protein
MAAQSRGSVKVRSWNSSPALGRSGSMYPSSSRQSRSTLTTQDAPQAGDFGRHLHPPGGCVCGTNASPTKRSAGISGQRRAMCKRASQFDIGGEAGQIRWRVVFMYRGQEPTPGSS